MPLQLQDLNRSQRRTAEEIYRQGRKVPRRLRAKFRQAALETGLVEQNLENRRGGDADSSNWRQERASGYGSAWATSGGPLNLRASVARFRREFLQHADPGERASTVAGQVQRPASQYLGRYQERAGDARSLRHALRAQFAGGGSASPSSSAGAQGAQAFDPGAVAGLALPEQRLPPEALVPASGGAQAPLDARAGLALPEGYQGVQSAGGPAPQVSAADGLQAQQGIAVQFGEHARQKASGGKPGLKGKLRGSGRVNPEHLADEVQSWAEQALGLNGGSRDRTVAGNAAVGGAGDSDHLQEAGRFGGREAVDLPTSAADGGWAKYRRVVRRLGLEAADGGFTTGTIKVGGKKFRVQVIFGEANDHGDHIHVGFRRA